jgi:hypothetical protein
MTSSFGKQAAGVGLESLLDVLGSSKAKLDPRGTAQVIQQVLRNQGAAAAREAAQATEVARRMPIPGAKRAALIGGLGTAAGLGANLAAPILGELIAGNIGDSRTGLVSGQGSKFLITPADEANYLKSIFQENQNRRALNAITPGTENDLPLLDAEAMLDKARDETRRSMAQAGERERALKFGLENIVQEGQSQRQAMMGVQQGTQTAGTVLQEAIAKVLSDTPGTQDQTILVEVGRAV